MSKSNILILLSGSIAAYKVCSLISSLKKKNYEVKIVTSNAALKFVGKATLEGLSGNPVYSDLWSRGSAMEHIYLERWSDLILAAPATAHLINRLAYGIGDDLLTNIFLAHQFNKPFLVAPAMNTSMYLSPVTQRSLETLKNYGISILESASGVLACGETGYGKLLEPDLLLQEVELALKAATPKMKAAALPQRDSRKRVLVTAGGTREPLDDVRFLTNVSTGLTGETIAYQLAELGFEVTLALAQGSAIVPRDIYQVKRFDSVTSLEELMKSELKNHYYDAFIHTAAVSDYTTNAFQGKLDSSDELTLKLKKTPKLVNMVKSWSSNPDIKLVAFKLTSKADPETIRAKVNKLISESLAERVVQNDIQTLHNRQQHVFHIYKNQHDDVVTCENILQLSHELIPLISGELK